MKYLRISSKAIPARRPEWQDLYITGTIKESNHSYCHSHPRSGRGWR